MANSLTVAVRKGFAASSPGLARECSWPETFVRHSASLELSGDLAERFRRDHCGELVLGPHCREFFSSVKNPSVLGLAVENQSENPVTGQLSQRGDGRLLHALLNAASRAARLDS